MRNQTRLKIRLITPSLRYGGGMQRYVCELTERLLKHGYSVAVFCLSYDKSLFHGYKNLSVHRFPIISHLPRFLQYVAFAIKIQIKTNKLPAINISTARIFNADIAIVGGTHKRHNKAMGKRNGLYDIIEIFLEKNMYKNAKHIIAHSELMVEEINAYKLGVEQKIQMCYPPVSNKAFFYVKPEGKALYRQKLNLPEDKFILLALGTENPRKGTPQVVKALKQLDSDNFFLVILGKSYNAPLPKNARFEGLVDNVQDYYAAADITIAPSVYEPFGLITIESLTVGTPVIISSFLGSKNFVNAANGIIIDKVDPISIKNAILRASSQTFKTDPNFLRDNNLTWEEHFKIFQKLFLSYTK